MSLKQDRGILTKGQPGGLRRAISGTAAVLFVGLYAWHIYEWETTGVDPFRQAMVFAFNDHPDVSVPLSFGSLVVGVLLGWRQFLKGGKFGIKPLLIIAAVVALVIFGWSKVNDI